MSISKEITNEVRKRAGCACEYCGVSEIASGGLLTVDHFHPRVAGGTSELENLIYACFRCNTYKADYWPTHQNEPELWNPRKEPRENHLLLLASGELHPITKTGIHTLTQLRLNRPALVTYRLDAMRQREINDVMQGVRELLAAQKSLEERELLLVELQQQLLQQQRQLLELLGKLKPGPR